MIARATVDLATLSILSRVLQTVRSSRAIYMACDFAKPQTTHTSHDRPRKIILINLLSPAELVCIDLFVIFEFRTLQYHVNNMWTPPVLSDDT